jgi:hypothetical protein
MYSVFPVREVRSDVMNWQYRSDLKVWLRKYPTPKEQQKHPFQTFERGKSAFEIVKNEVKKFLSEYNIKMKTNTQDGNLTDAHYMTLLQKLTSIINQDLMRIHFNLPPNYDFVLDPSHKKKGNAQKEFKAYVMQDMGNNQTPVTIYLNDNSYRLTKKDIIDIFTYINTVAGYEVISSKTANMSWVPHPVFDITDTDLLKQQQIKAIRPANKAKDLSKEDVASKVWKYRCIPPSLESEYFERNVSDAKDLTKIRQLVPTNEFKRNDFAEQPPSNWVRPGIKSEYLSSKKKV